MSTRTGRARGLGAALTLVATLTLAACGGGDGGTTPQGGSTASGELQPVDAATVSLPAPTQSLNPTASVSATDRASYSLINGTFFRVNADGEVDPDLAEDITFNEDFTSATVKLRSDLKFSDGTPLTAADAAATWQYWLGVQGSVLGSVTGRVASVTAPDDTTVEIAFKGPFPSFREASANPGLGVFPAASVANPDFYNQPVTSGPYRVVSPWASNKLELEVNENYWGPKPLVQAITLTVIEDANSAVSQLQSDQVDFAGDLPPNFVTQIQNTPGLTVTNTPVFGFYDIRMWNQAAPFNDPNMRQAVAYALDREAIVESIWGDGNEPQAGFWPRTMEGYDDSVPVERDLDKAREYLAQTQCADGCAVRMMYSDQEFPFSSQLALLVQDQLKDVDIDVQLEKLEAATLISRLRAGDYDLVPGAMSGPVNIPDQVLANALLGTGALKAEFTGYASAEMDALIAQANGSSGEERTESLAAIEQQYGEDRPFATYATWVRGTATSLPEGLIRISGAGVVVAGEQA
jgi:peptide/nickel transport system substrate-binding protein